MQHTPRTNRVLLNNLIWFVAALLMAFLVWVIATAQADPIQERRLPQQIPIQIDLDPGLIVVDQNTRNASVTVRAQQSVLSMLTTEDVIVRANLIGRGSGTHTVELETVMSRRAIADTQPRQITVTLEEVQTQQVEIVAHITAQPPPSYDLGGVSFSQSQVLASGAASRVRQVVAAQAVLDLGNQRANLELEARLTPVDADGRPVPEVTLEPQVIDVSVLIARRDDVSEVVVTPDIDVSSLPEGYVLLSINWEPKTVLVIGSQEELAALPQTLRTEIIDLTERSGDFEVSVPVVFPERPLPLLGDQTVTVTISISAQTVTRQFENVPVDTIGLEDNLQAQLIPERVTVLVTGPRTALEALQTQDIRAVVDLNGLATDTHDITPSVAGLQGEIGPQDVSILPATVTVTITTSDQPTPTTSD
jgi:YbbR domain-containing protein